ncbi:MAG: YncE family protein, partial [Mycobacterium sp.]
MTGVVSGTVIATDPDGNTLSYTVAAQPANGTVAVDSSTGGYTYTPTSAARLAAGTTPQAVIDTFSVSVSDGQSAITAPVSVYVSPTQLASASSTTVGSSPSATTVNQDGTRAYVANTKSNTVSVIDTNPASTTYNKVISTITVGSSPSALAVSGTRLYVANAGSNSVSVIDTTTNKVIDTNPSAFGTNPISVGSSPSALAVSGTRLYVANAGSNSVSVIDTTTNKVIDTNPSAFGTNPISVGSSPSALA